MVFRFFGLCTSESESPVSWASDFSDLTCTSSRSRAWNSFSNDVSALPRREQHRPRGRICHISLTGNGRPHRLTGRIEDTDDGVLLEQRRVDPARAHTRGQAAPLTHRGGGSALSLGILLPHVLMPHILCPTSLYPTSFFPTNGTKRRTRWVIGVVTSMAGRTSTEAQSGRARKDKGA